MIMPKLMIAQYNSNDDDEYDNDDSNGYRHDDIMVRIMILMTRILYTLS